MPLLNTLYKSFLLLLILDHTMNTSNPDSHRGSTARVMIVQRTDM